MKRTSYLGLGILILVQLNCKTEVAKNGSKSSIEEKRALTVFTEAYTPIVQIPENVATPEGMVWVPGAIFKQGAVPQDKMAMGHEKPAIQVVVDGFFMDATEVTNAQFQKFIDATGYLTLAERALDWEVLKKQVPAGTPKPHDSILQPGALTFKKSTSSLDNLYDFSQWWNWTVGASWKHPNGPESSVQGLANHPVVQVAYEDALAYCEWAGRRLPTEAEWELASRGGTFKSIFTWGDDSALLKEKANTWEGDFPVENTQADGFELRAPVQSYPPNAYGLYDMAGNVWEWTSDWYHADYYHTMATQQSPLVNPTGATNPYTPNNPLAKEKVIKGGSYLCSDSYCASYRISARMGTTIDSALEHIGFRTVVSAKMLDKK